MNFPRFVVGGKNINRYFKIFWLRTQYRMLGNRKKVLPPKKMTDAEKTASAIFTHVLLDPNTKLYYDIETNECYLRSEDSTIYIFLEKENIKVINSVYGYDVAISTDLECFLTDRFRREMSLRRKDFKGEALSKVEHSLETTLKKLKENKNN